MSEQELKLHVPRHVGTRVLTDMRKLGAASTRLLALYFDTSDRALVQARVALRLRKEGRRWIQTLKMPGDHALARIEINHPRPGPELDLSLYAGTPAEAVMSRLGKSLTVCYETNILRLYKQVRTRKGLVEIAFDRGSLRAGDLTLPVSEIEFELVRGDVEAIFAIGQRWLDRYPLIMDMRSKAERGDRLAQTSAALASIADDTSPETPEARQKIIQDFWSPRGAKGVKLAPDLSLRGALSAITTECLDQIVRNAAFLAEVDTLDICRAGTAEHIHQLRVGIRRLRSAWSLFSGLPVLPPETIRQEVKVHFAALGTSRDDDVLRDALMPILTKAGLPPIELGVTISSDEAHTLVTSHAFQSWLLNTLKTCVLPPPPTAVAASVVTDLPSASIAVQHPPEKAANVIVNRLRKWHKRISRDGLQFKKLDIDSQHELRKRAKRLRYGLQFAESLLPSGRLKAYRKRLSVVQDILGDMNDLVVAKERFESLRETQPGAWFACGWITSRLSALNDEAAAALAQLAKSDQFWK